MSVKTLSYEVLVLALLSPVTLREGHFWPGQAVFRGTFLLYWGTLSAPNDHLSVR